MKWIKGIKQLQSAKSILEGLVNDIVAGEVDSTEDIPRRIASIQSALEDAKRYFLEENI